jgi:RNA polymerase primary sigma factor
MMKDNTSHYINQSEISSYLFDVRKYDALTRDQETELIKKIKTGCQRSKELLILSNLRFVISVAKQYMNQGLSLSDLISEGNYGLVKAAEKFNYEEANVRFLSYAVWWVKQSMMQSLNDNCRTIRLPVNIINDMAKHAKLAPSEYTEETPKSIVGLPHVSRLDDSMDEDGNTFHDVVEDKSAERPDLVFADDRQILMAKLKRILSNLTESEQYVVTKYFGLDGDTLTLQDISEDLELTKERVRQIKEKAIKKLRFYSSDLFELL